MIEWKEFALEEVVEKFIDYRGKTPKKTASGVPLITAKIVKNGRINTPNEFIALEDYDKWMTRGIPQKGDVVMTTEAPLGEVAQLCFDGKVALAQRIITMRGKVNVLDNGFLKYMLQSPLMQHRIHSRSSGTTVIGIKSSELKKIPIPVPPIDIQKKIASILGSIDEKIELNLKMNETLEEMAMTLYKHWFVDFGPFQDEEFVESELGMIPKGWEVVSLGNLIEIKHGYAFKSKYFSESGDYIVLTPGNFKENGGIKSKGEKEKFYNGDFPKQYLLNEGDLLVVMTDLVAEAPLLGSPAFINENDKYLHNQRLGKVILKDENQTDIFYIYETLNSPYVRNIIRAGASGTTVKHTSPSRIKEIKVINPPSEIQKQFGQYLSGFFNLIKNNEKEVRDLQATRDFLLPRLLSGEIDVSKAEKQVEEVL